MLAGEGACGRRKDAKVLVAELEVARQRADELAAEVEEARKMAEEISENIFGARKRSLQEQQVRPNASLHGPPCVPAHSPTEAPHCYTLTPPSGLLRVGGWGVGPIACSPIIFIFISWLPHEFKPIPAGVSHRSTGSPLGGQCVLACLGGAVCLPLVGNACQQVSQLLCVSPWWAMPAGRSHSCCVSPPGGLAWHAVHCGL